MEKILEILSSIGVRLRGKVADFVNNTKKLLFVFVVFAVAYGVSLYFMDSWGTVGPTVIGVSILAVYVYLISYLYFNLEVQSHHFWQVPVFYVFLMIAISYAFVPVLYEYKESFAPEMILDDFDAFYFAVITLTSVGYGEVHPIDNQGKVISISMALIGSIHMIIFVALLFERFMKSTKK
ncbi:TPA: potassium channel family protein [Vibrio diabolicus]